DEGRRRQVLAQHQLPDRDRAREQELLGTLRLLVGEEPHRDARDQEQHHDPDHAVERTQQLIVQVDLGEVVEELELLDLDDLRVEGQHRGEEQEAADHGEQRQHHVRHGRHEERAELAPRDRKEMLHAGTPSAARSAPSVTRVKISSSRSPPWVSSPSDPSSTLRPPWIRITRRQIASTSARMCVESTTVWRSSSTPEASAAISPRISRIWIGSRPIVGSSRIRTGGSCTIACATPTRWR